MDNPLVVALGITVVGMTLLFLALVLFYGLLSLLTTVFEKRAPQPQAAAPAEEAKAESETHLPTAAPAAAIAVALARAQVQAPAPQGLTDTGGDSLSPWWSLHHQREITRNPNVGRAP